MPDIIGWPRSRKRSVHRLALAPSCWGISDVPDWGHQIDAERVLSEAAAVGEGAVTAGPSGFLPDRSDVARPMLRRLRIQVVAGHVQAILHQHDTRGPELAHIDGHASWLGALGAELLILSAIPERASSSTGTAPLSKAEWANLLHLIGSVEHVCARHRLKLAVQPTFGSIIQGAAEIERLLVGSEAGLCVDVAQLFFAGEDAVDVIEEAAGRIRHVQLNDLDTNLAYQVRGYSLGYNEAVSLGLYRPLGEGGTDVRRVIEALRRKGYRGWYSLAQEVRLASNEDRPLGPISRSLEYVLPLLS